MSINASNSPTSVSPETNGQTSVTVTGMTRRGNAFASLGLHSKNLNEQLNEVNLNKKKRAQEQAKIHEKRARKRLIDDFLSRNDDDPHRVINEILDILQNAQEEIKEKHARIQQKEEEIKTT